MDKIIEWDQQLTIFLNSFHTPAFDSAAMLATSTVFWTPLYLFIIYGAFKKYETQAWVWIGGMLLTVLLADQLTSTIMKPFFERLRPSHDPTTASFIHIVDNYKGGLYGFASSHAANTFGVALFTFRLFHKQFRWVGIIFIWAAFVGYTRIYLGVHFVGDVVAGMLVGWGCAHIAFMATRWSILKFKSQGSRD